MMADILDVLSTESHDVSSLRYAFTSAATVPYELIVRMRNELPVEAVGTGYGLTEATAIVSVTTYDDGPETVANTSGRPISGVEVKTVDADSVETPRGEAGELLVRGFNVMRGYWQDPEATAAAIDEDGWLRTGDIATIDAQGNIKITDRLKDMFIVGGFNAYPAEIEALLLGDERIAQVAVIGMPDARLGEVAAAFVIPRPGVHLTADDVIEWGRAHLANFKVPRHVEIVDTLPINATGKVLKQELRARVATEGYERART
jgi:acyl-CoA synthetase (AMP-forming)/AMP-acid ligase II